MIRLTSTFMKKFGIERVNMLIHLFDTIIFELNIYNLQSLMTKSFIINLKIDEE